MSDRRKTLVMDKSVFVALLRGINVGGKNKLPMAELAGLFEEAGCQDVRTYIQSGNVVYRAGTHLVKAVPRSVAAAIEQRYGYSVPVVTRSAAELSAIVAENPFLLRTGDEAVDPKSLHVAFLQDKPTASRVRELDPDRSPPDEFVLSGREVFLHCPNGLARTKLTNAWLDSKLKTVSTVRNWKTVGVLAEWSADPQSS